MSFRKTRQAAVRCPRAPRRNTTVNELKRELEVAYQKGELHQLLPSSTTLRLYGAWQTLSDATQTAAARARSWWEGVPPPLPVRTPPPIDAPRLIELLFDVHGHQLLFDGFFNGDPHPGNIMLCDDGRIGLIDWGQVKRLQLPQRLQLARLLVALADRDHVLTAATWRDLGFTTARQHPWVYDKWAQ